LSQKSRWSHITELLGTGAVVVSLIYVGLQIKQNTAAIQTSTSQEIYTLHQERSRIETESPEYAEFLIRAARRPHEMSAADSLRYSRFLNLKLNLQEAVYTNALQGTLEAGMASGWLDGMRDLRCLSGMAEYWQNGKSGYHPDFRAGMDSVFATTTCDD
jgi:hypothetical protein